MKQGLFITFEGIDGVGKSTQMDLLAKRIRELEHTVVTTREPGGTSLGNYIRKILLEPDLCTVDATAEALLYAADRAQHVHEVVKPALMAGKIVISDRFLDSSIAYQGYGLDRDIEMILAINKWAIDGVMPQLTICLDQEPEIALQRTNGDRIEQRAVEFYNKVRTGFHKLATQEPERFVLIDAAGTINQISDKIWDVFWGRNLL